MTTIETFAITGLSVTPLKPRQVSPRRASGRYSIGPLLLIMSHFSCLVLRSRVRTARRIGVRPGFDCAIPYRKFRVPVLQPSSAHNLAHCTMALCRKAHLRTNIQKASKRCSEVRAGARTLGLVHLAEQLAGHRTRAHSDLDRLERCSQPPGKPPKLTGLNAIRCTCHLSWIHHGRRTKAAQASKTDPLRPTTPPRRMGSLRGAVPCFRAHKAPIEQDIFASPGPETRDLAV